MKREIFVLRSELREVVDRDERRRIVREIATLESQLMDRGISV